MPATLELQRIVYCSQAARPDLALPLLAEVLAVSDRNNRRDGLTGVLLISRGRFFQVLEGAAQNLDRTMNRIRLDPRHHDVELVSRRPIRSRRFGEWAMVAARITPQQQPQIDAVIDHCRDAPEAAVDAARALLDQQIAA